MIAYQQRISSLERIFSFLKNKECSLKKKINKILHNKIVIMQETTKVYHARIKHSPWVFTYPFIPKRAELTFVVNDHFISLYKKLTKKTHDGTRI